MNWIKEKKTYHLLFQIGIILLPLIEIYRSFFGDSLHLLGFAVEELLLLAWVGSLFVAGVLFSLGEKRKKVLLFTAVYLFIFLVFLILHAWNASCFNASLLPGAAPSFVREAYYTVRMYLAPTSLVLSALLLSLPRKKLFLALKGALWVIVLSIVIPDALGFSFASYQDGNVVVEGGFFTWFSLPDGTDWAKYTAKGLFSAANDVGAILFGLTSVVAYDVLKKGKVFDFVLLFFTGLASVMVSTKIGVYGFFLALGAMLFVRIVEIFLCKAEKQKIVKPLIAAGILLVLIPLFLISPGKKLQDSRNVQEETADRPTESVDEIEGVTGETDSLSQEDTALLQDYLSQHYWDHFIDPWFLELYPVECDPEFWAEITARDNHLNSDSRSFKLEMIRRIREQNDRPLDDAFGIGFTSGVPYAERDYLYQYYLFGWVGVVFLLLPFFTLFFCNLLSLLSSLFRRKALLQNSSLCLSLFAFFATAYFAGHVFDTLFTTYFVSLAAAGVVSLRDPHEE